MLRAAFFFSEHAADEERVLPPPLRLGFSAVDEVARPEAPQAAFGRFDRDRDGAVVRLRTQGRTLRRVDEEAGA
jgi:hypothetical protein